MKTTIRDQAETTATAPVQTLIAKAQHFVDVIAFEMRDKLLEGYLHRTSRSVEIPDKNELTQAWQGLIQMDRFSPEATHVQRSWAVKEALTTRGLEVQFPDEGNVSAFWDGGPNPGAGSIRLLDPGLAFGAPTPENGGKIFTVVNEINAKLLGFLEETAQSKGTPGIVFKNGGKESYFTLTLESPLPEGRFNKALLIHQLSNYRYPPFLVDGRYCEIGVELNAGPEFVTGNSIKLNYAPSRRYR